MQDHIICPHCQKQFPLTQAISQQIDQKYRNTIDQLKRQSDDERNKLIAQAKIRIEEERAKAQKEAEAQLRTKITDEISLKLKDSQNASEELKKQKESLQNQLLELTRLIRKLQDENKEKELALMKQFHADQEKFREDEQKRIAEQYRLQIFEKEKKLQDAIRANEDLRRKLEQGSQQTQGEALEVALEDMLRHQFPSDEIAPVQKGVLGADIIQQVKNRFGVLCGTIIWEAKRTKSWSAQWIPKLKSDQRSAHAEIAILVSEVLPEQIPYFSTIDGVWVSRFDCALALASALRVQLLEVAGMKKALDGQETKKDIVFQYITSVEFRHKLEAIVESFHLMQQEVEKEKRWFAQKWAREEKSLQTVIGTTLGLNGQLQSLVGQSIEDLTLTDQPTTVQPQELFEK